MKEQLAPTNQIPNELRILTNVAFLMADVTDTFLLDAYSRVRSLGMDFKREEKQKWKRAVEQTRLARKAWQGVAEQMYNVPDVDTACEDSDLKTIWKRNNECFISGHMAIVNIPPCL